MKRITLFLYALFVNVFILKAQDVPLPTAAQLTWQDAELVALFSYDLPVFDGKTTCKAITAYNPFPM